MLFEIMPKYHEIKFKLTRSQLQKIEYARSAGSSVKLRLSNAHISPHGTPLLLTAVEVSRLNDGRVHDVTISHKRLSKTGGILPIIPIIAGLIAAAAGTAGGVAGTVSSIKSSRAADAERNAAKAAEELAKLRIKELGNK